MKNLLRRTALAVLLVAAGAALVHNAVLDHSGASDAPAGPAKAADPVKAVFRKGDRVVFVGNTFAEREVLFGYIETVLQSRLPELGLTFRNLGYSADTASVLLADITKGDTEHNREANRALNFG